MQSVVQKKEYGSNNVIIISPKPGRCPNINDDVNVNHDRLRLRGSVIGQGELEVT
jgi:hypothetical protein